ncbi:unnamed protein product [Pseudo-nitzschia multistriata]|uniref:Uncharacterized protein n=1 Tax=Pseudo-nitzschia multistriata TaxID=183589 RepID=A0A448YZV7_9STRA|nr:unnamed protein product [Pseudo-nitzschia multistriata]
METAKRLQGYQKRGYQWPVLEFVPNTPGWKKLMEDRLEQISNIEDPAERFKGYTATMYSGIVIQNYTEHGFARTRISESLLKELQQGIRDGFEDRVNEGYTPSITGNQAWHIQRDDLTQKVEDELHDKLEEWGRVDLDLTYVYGLRLFRNTTTIKMHLDKKGSHSMGYVLHVDSSDDYDSDGDPWPFLIEDFHGRTHEITMVPGDLILFEAAKLVHGRPHQLNATWYCNVVGHYYPRDETWASMNHVAEAEYAVPPKWANEPSGSSKADDAMVREIQFRGGLREPGCMDGWCRSTSLERIQWKGPSGPSTHWIDANGESHEFMGRLKQKEEQKAVEL